MNRMWKHFVVGVLICFMVLGLMIAPVTALGQNQSLSENATVSISTLMTDKVIGQLSVLNLGGAAAASAASTDGTATATVVTDTVTDKEVRRTEVLLWI